MLELGKKVFYECLLDSVYIGGKIKYSTSKQDGYSPFYNNKSLRTVVISNQEEQIYKNEFYGCTNLKHVNIGDGVSSIGDYAFSECVSLENISLGDKTSDIGEGTFYGCRQLKSIICKAITPPSCYDDSFSGVDKNNCTLEVVKEGVQEYKSTHPWCEFSNIKAIGLDPIYTITYMVDGETMQTDSVAYGTAITLLDEPTKEGHTFSGWSEAPETMPASDVIISGTFTINKYLVIFKIGDEVIAADSLEYGASIIAPEAPEKEGHTFNGWGEVVEIVPANDVAIEGSYSVNSYLLTYRVDGETVQTDSVEYGATITLLDEPTKEGYTFSGWSEAPETMPASDVIISGTFTVNKYLVTFKIGDKVIAADSLEYGAAIVTPEAPEKEGYTFDGWGEVAETVPASDVTYEGTYTVNIYKVYYYVGDELVHTAEVAYGEAIPEYVYEPTEEGYTFLGWVGDTYETMPAHDVSYTANIDDAIRQLTIDNGKLTIYDLTGHKIEVDDLRELRKGIYVVNGQKIIVKD